MKKPSTRQIKSSIRHIFHAANRRLQRFYEEFADILDSDEDRLSLQFNNNVLVRPKKSFRRVIGAGALKNR